MESRAIGAVRKNDGEGTIRRRLVRPQVKMYTLSTCGHCRNVKKFLRDCEVRFEFTDVDLLTGEQRREILETVRALNPACSFPTIMIGERVIVGFREEEIREALGL